MGTRTTVAAALTLAGGVAATVGSFLTWAELRAGPISEQARGIEGWEGKATLVAGVVMIIAGVRVFAGAGAALSRLRVGASIGGLAAVGVGLYTALTAKQQLIDVAAADGDLTRATIERALDSGLLELSLAVGLFVVIAGGIQGILAVLVSIGLHDEPVSGGSRGLTGWSARTASPIEQTPRVPDRRPRGPWPLPPPPAGPDVTDPSGPGVPPPKVIRQPPDEGDHTT